jgi:hypothetical protein
MYMRKCIMKLSFTYLLMRPGPQGHTGFAVTVQHFLLVILLRRYMNDESIEILARHLPVETEENH